MSKRSKNIVKIIVSLILVGWLIFSVNWKEVLGYLIGVNFYFLLLFVILYVVGILISSYKWKILANFKGFSQPFYFFVKTYVLGIFLNNFFPSFVGGDTYRVVALGRAEKKIHSSASSVVFDRVSGLLTAMILGVVFGLFNLGVMEKFAIWNYFIYGVGVVLLIVAGLAYFYPSKFVQRISGFLPKVISKHFEELSEYRNFKIIFFSMIWATGFSFVGLAFCNYVLFAAVGINIGVLNYLSVIFFISIISSVPISVGNIGVKEWAYIAFFGIFGVPSSAAISVVILSRVIQLLVSLVALPLYLQDTKMEEKIGN